MEITIKIHGCNVSVEVSGDIAEWHDQRDLERRARKHRLIQRGAIFESVFPRFKTIEDNEAVQAFLIALSHLPGAAEITEKTQGTGDEG